MSRQKRAFVCVLIAWLCGTVVFESIAAHGDVVNSAPTESKSQKDRPSGWLVQQTMQRYETTKAIAMTELRGLVSVSENAEIVARMDEVIAAETSGIVKLHRPKARIKRVPAAPNQESLPAELKIDGLNVDAIVGVMPVATWVTRMAYRQLDRSVKPVGLHDLTRHRLALDQARESALPGLMRLAIDQRAEHLMVMAEYKSKFYGQTKASPVSTRKPNTSTRQNTNSPNRAKQPSTGSQTQNTRSKQSGSKEVGRAEYVQKTGAAKGAPFVTPVSGAQAAQQVDSGYDLPREVGADLVPAVAESVTSTPTPSDFATSPSDRSVAANSEQVAPMHSDSVSESSVLQGHAAANQTQARTTLPPAKHQVLQQPIVGDRTTISQRMVQTERMAPRTPVASDPKARLAAQWPLDTQTSSNQPNVTLNVENTDVRSILEILARGYGMNILVSPDVQGTVTANVEGLTPDQTLQGVMKMCNLRAQVDQGVIYVYPADKLPQDARVVRHFPLDFARAESIEPALQGLLSPIGTAYINKLDAEDNLKTREAIVVIDTLDSLARIENYIIQVDRAPRQVMIEARVLEVELTDDIQNGVNFDSLLGGDLSIGSFGLADGLPSASNPLFFAQIDGSRVQALLDIVETTTDAKTLATPKVMVVNGQNARIQVGQQLGFTVATVTQTSTIQDVQFLETGVVLSVTPTISRDGKIMMEVKPEVSNGQINPSTLLPEEETRELETSVLLNNHQGVVIGGLIQENDRTVIRKLPWLGDVKHVGKLFQRREEVRSRSEIIIALVPHIVEIDNHHQRDHFDEERWDMDYQRTQSPLLHGPLKRACRPWEPRLPDTFRNSSHLDVNRINRMIP